MNHYWLDGIMGVVIGDALGVPYEFRSRDEMKQDPATDMLGYGTYNLPPGTWSDDSSMTLASLISLSESLRKDEPIDFRDMMEQFASWAVKGEYTAYGEVLILAGRHWMRSTAIRRTDRISIHAEDPVSTTTEMALS